ncbi:MAG: hypothetical protein Q7S52_00595 [bacterium]|nr:hypothetical protein [bacterium]
MKPLSRNKRRGYLLFFFLVFVVSAPIFILQAKGYRINWGDVVKISQTGGLYISNDQSGIAIAVNDELVKTTSIVQKGIFIQDLKPGSYAVSASKEGLQTWHKTLKVFPEIVTEARTFLIASEPELVSVPRFLEDDRKDATSTPQKLPVKNPDYEAINALFLPPPPKTAPIKPEKLATTSIDGKTLNDILVKNEKGKLVVLWMGGEDEIPNYFCENISCKPEIIVRSDSMILSFDFFPGRDDLLIFRTEEGIYVSEIDDRSPQNMQKIISEPDFDFRIKDGKNVYLKKDALLYAVSL